MGFIDKNWLNHIQSWTVKHESHLEAISKKKRQNLCYCHCSENNWTDIVDLSLINQNIVLPYFLWRFLSNSFFARHPCTSLHTSAPCMKSHLKSGCFFFFISRPKRVYCTMSKPGKNLTANNLLFFEAQHRNQRLGEKSVDLFVFKIRF